MNKIRALVLLLACFPGFLFAQFNIRLEDAYTREMPPSATTAAVYLTIRNVGSHGVSLESISTSVAESAMIHQSTMQDGMMRMEHIPELYIGSIQDIRLEPGAIHIMLEGLRRPLRAGDLFQLNLSFSNGVVLRVDVPILAN